MELRTKTNKELFSLYDGELIFHHRSDRGLHEARRMLDHFHAFLGEYPPSVELAKAFLGRFGSRKATTLYRYAAIIKGFMGWYGEKLGVKIRVPKMLPDYVEDGDIDKLIDAMRAENKRTHKGSAKRDILLVDVAIHSGLRRAELANLTVGDIDAERQLLIVRAGKGAKDRSVPLSDSMAQRLGDYIRGRAKEESVFGLGAASISGKIRRFANKAGVKLHSHSLRDAFGTKLLERGATIREVQELLGHANLGVTERYTLLTAKHLRKAVNLLDDGQRPQPSGRPLPPWQSGRRGFAPQLLQHQSQAQRQKDRKLADQLKQGTEPEIVTIEDIDRARQMAVEEVQAEQVQAAKD